MEYRVRIQDRSKPPGRVSLWAASVIMTTLRAALRTEATMMSKRKSTRGKMSRLQRESVELSLVRVEAGSGTLVFESDVQTLIDLPDKVFEDFVVEAHRNGEPSPNTELQKILLNLEVLFANDSPIEWIEFNDNRGSPGRYDAGKIEKIRSKLVASETTPESVVASLDVVGRLLEIDLSKQTLQIHTVHDQPDTISFADFMEPIIKESLERFVLANVTVNPSGVKELLSLEPIESVPESRFFENPNLEQIIAEQQVSALKDFAALEIPDAEGVPLEDFIKFRRGETQ